MVRKFSSHYRNLLIGGLWVLGIVAYELFKIIPEAQLAGNIAGQLFKMMAYVGMASSIYLLIQRVYQYGTNALKQGFSGLFYSCLS